MFLDYGFKFMRYFFSASVQNAKRAIKGMSPSSLAEGPVFAKALVKNFGLLFKRAMSHEAFDQPSSYTGPDI